jgi:hypothetical protein
MTCDNLNDYYTQTEYICLDGDYALDQVLRCHISPATQFENWKFKAFEERTTHSIK